MGADIRSIMIGKFVQLDDPENANVCTLSRITHDLGGGFFLATRISRRGEDICEHVISLAMLAVHDGAEVFPSFEAAVDAVGPADTTKHPALN